MNVLQFWLIDSIVKASTKSSVSLDEDVPDVYSSHDREPLFRASEDDDDDYRPTDVERGRHVSRSRSPEGRDKSSSGTTTPEEYKSSGSGPSSSEDPTDHAYPPSLTNSTSSRNTPPKPAKNLLKKANRRPAPAPLSLQTNNPPAVNSPSITPAPHLVPRVTVVPQATSIRKVEAVAESADVWADTWDDSDDWANRVGEEDWTGRRVGQTKDALHTAWSGNAAQIQERSVMSSSVVNLSSSSQAIDDGGSSTILNIRVSDASDISSPLPGISLDRERQRTMDVDMAMQLSRARRETVLGSPKDIAAHPVAAEEQHLDIELSTVHPNDNEAGGLPHNSSRIDLNMLLDHAHDPSLITHAAKTVREPTNESLFGLPTYQANLLRLEFDFSPMEEFAAAEKAALDLSQTTKFSLDALRPPRRLPTTERSRSEAGPSILTQRTLTFESQVGQQSEDVLRPSLSGARQRKLSHSNPHPRTHRKGLAGKMALFEAPHDSSNSGLSAMASRLSVGLGRHQPNMYGHVLPETSITTTGHDRPYRFSFYSNALAATIHARSLSELPADGQTFEQLFGGMNHDNSANSHSGSGQPAHRDKDASPASLGASPNGFGGGTNGAHRMSNPHLEDKRPGDSTAIHGDSDDRTWWLD
ncbi:hypothetical protein H0H81_000616, partial [Sphagnurus paluster]